MREIIQFGEGDTIPAVRQKLEQVQSRQVAVVVPVGHPAVQTELHLKLLRRAAEAMALDMVLVTDDQQLAGLARSTGLRTASGSGKIKAAAPVRSSSAGGKPQAKLATLERVRGAAHAPQAGLKLPALRRPSLGGARQHMALLITGVAALWVIVLGLGLALPSATVTLSPKGESASVERDVLASADIQQVDYERGRVPARQVQIQVTGTEEGQTTGRRSAPDRRATGEVVFTNKTMGEVTVPKGTVVRTTDGETTKFYTLLDATLPGAYGAMARVPVEATDAGPRGNVEALTVRVVEGAPSYQVEVLNDRPIQGGNDKRVGIVASEDMNRLRASIVQKLQQEAYNQLVAHLSQGDWIPADSLDVAIVDEVFDKKVDDQADNLRLTMQVRVTGLAVDGEGTRELLVRSLESRGNGSLVVNDATLTVQQPVGTAQVESGAIRFKASAKATLVPAINLKAASGHIAGQDPESAARWLAEQCELSEPPQISISPGFWPRLPFMPSRIKVQLSGGSS